MTDKNAHILRRKGKEFPVLGTAKLGKLKVAVLTHVHGAEQAGVPGWQRQVGPKRRDEGAG